MEDKAHLYSVITFPETILDLLIIFRLALPLAYIHTHANKLLTAYSLRMISLCCKLNNVTYYLCRSSSVGCGSSTRVMLKGKVHQFALGFY